MIDDIPWNILHVQYLKNAFAHNYFLPNVGWLTQERKSIITIEYMDMLDLY